ncbi:CoA-acylating methylmalonate-semialdehyde dehydrogenase [Aquicella lusitana]|uniref:methylmalonate-semialdehyde dehydrogenase (CoA acylating) n=1 Tax=Aquicella lusitana TaxID=254246 RepID=A0A370GHC6_9COXI|nr:CoA-acylating methylmalonate-semialdehyde dehydrogenase [Aquicella lusitana]RDI42569.1 methylmalonate-semialdehyde dehydrogenase [acylating] [Aquicella lusitana]VVC74348.1 Putative 3-oxopropanoate dehydrogenase [Aquicella lusitana]
MPYDVPHIINGQPIVIKERNLNIYNPATGEVIGHVGVADQLLVDKAVKAAQSAFETWSTTPPPQRAKILFQYKFLLDQNIDQLAKLVTQEHGKTLAEAKASVQRGIDVVDYTCGIPNHLKGSFAEEVAKDMDCYSLHQPLGVCAGITPFNFPAMIALWMFPMAIACGNTFILKPSEKDPSCSVRLIELAMEAGVPKGVINLVHGDKETVDVLLMHPGIKAISFVGSSAVAEHVHQTATIHNKRVQAFGGAKNHCIVMPDADPDQVADALVTSAYGSAGERCMALSVATIIGEKFTDALIAKMKPRIEQLKIGPGTEAGVEMGPLVTQQHWERVKSYIDIGKQEGATLVVDGSEYKPKNFESGFFMGGTLFDHVKPSMRIYREEIFGPVLSIVRTPDLNTALKLVNEHEYGNGTAIFTRDGYAARTFAEKVQAGMVGINVPVPVPVAYQSFGGWKRSIFSDIGMYGSEAVRFYTKLKTVTQRWFPRT